MSYEFKCLIREIILALCSESIWGIEIRINILCTSFGTIGLFDNQIQDTSINRKLKKSKCFWVIFKNEPVFVTYANNYYYI